MTATERLTEVTSLAGHTDRVWHAAWNPQGTLLATCSSDLVSWLWLCSKQNNFSPSSDMPFHSFDADDTIMGDGRSE